MPYRPAVQTEIIRGGAIVCKCHGWSVRKIRRSGSWGFENDFQYIHCEHPENYIVYEDIDIPPYCEKCGWNLGRYDRRI